MLFFATKSLRHMKLIISMKPQEIKKKRIEKTNFLIVHKHFFFWSTAQNNQKNNGKEHLGFFFNRCDRCAPLRPPPSTRSGPSILTQGHTWSRRLGTEVMPWWLTDGRPARPTDPVGVCCDREPSLVVPPSMDASNLSAMLVKGRVYFETSAIFLASVVICTSYFCSRYPLLLFIGCFNYTVI